MNGSAERQQLLEWGGVILALILLATGQANLAAAILLITILLFGYHLVKSATSTPAKIALTSPAVASSAVNPPPKVAAPATESRADQNLLKANERLRVAMESARDGVVILDEDGKMMECNPAAERLLGIEREHFMNKPFVEMLSEMTHANEVAGLGYTAEELDELARPLRIRQGRITRRKFTTSTQNSSGTQKLVIEEIGSPVYAQDGTVIGQMLVLRDISHHEKLLDFRDQVMHMAVHDLRGPLTAILNGIDLTLLTDSPLDEDDSNRILRLCMDSGNSLMRQIDSLLDIAQIETNSLPLKPEPQKINELVDSAYKTLANTFTEMRIKLESTFPDDLPEIMADREIMRRVFVNLLDNALRFTVRGTQVRVNAKVNDEARTTLLISISDNGPGIPESQRTLVFEPYRRLAENGRTSGGRRGVGLGLTFCKLAIEAHGGSISVEDAEDGMSGARFVVRLPLKP